MFHLLPFTTVFLHAHWKGKTRRSNTDINISSITMTYRWLDFSFICLSSYMWLSDLGDLEESNWNVINLYVFDCFLGRNQLGRTYSPGLPLSMCEREEIVKLFQVRPPIFSFLHSSKLVFRAVGRSATFRNVFVSPTVVWAKFSTGESQSKSIFVLSQWCISDIAKQDQ